MSMLALESHHSDIYLPPIGPHISLVLMRLVKCGARALSTSTNVLRNFRLRFHELVDMVSSYPPQLGNTSYLPSRLEKGVHSLDNVAH
jgi:hypothetical protein